MLNTVHVSVAAVIVQLIPNPVISLPAALVSHIILDTVPHWNWRPGGNRIRVAASVSDIVLAVGLSIGYSFLSVDPMVVLAACFLSTVPDLIQGPYYFWHFKPGWLQRFIGWESRRQKWPWMPMWLGIATQIIVLGISLSVIFIGR